MSIKQVFEMCLMFVFMDQQFQVIIVFRAMVTLAFLFADWCRDFQQTSFFAVITYFCKDLESVEPRNNFCSFHLSPLLLILWMQKNSEFF
jgi:hypothetical protein